MKYLLTLLLVFSSITDPVTKIAKSNRLKKEAKVALNEGNLESAVSSYIQLLDSMEVVDDVARLNLANAAYLLSYGGDNIGLMSDISSGKKQVQDSAALSQISDDLQYFNIADTNYRTLKDSDEPTVASSAFNQMGIISYKLSEQSPDERESFIQSSLSHFKGSLKKNPENEAARYNYELLKKLIRQQEEEEKQDQDQDKQDEQKKDEENKDQEKKDQEKKDQQDQEKKDQEKQENQDQEKKDEQNKDQQKQDDQPQEEDPMQKIKDKLKEMNISPEKAQMILEAMKNNEVQYVQQNKRKASKRKRSDKPDW